MMGLQWEPSTNSGFRNRPQYDTRVCYHDTWWDVGDWFVFYDLEIFGSWNFVDEFLETVKGLATSRDVWAAFKALCCLMILGIIYCLCKLFNFNLGMVRIDCEKSPARTNIVLLWNTSPSQHSHSLDLEASSFCWLGPLGPKMADTPKLPLVGGLEHQFYFPIYWE